MFARNFVLIGAAAVLTTVAGTDAFARGGHRGHGKAHACYKKVRTPDVYKTVKVKVRVSRASCTRKIIPAVFGEKKVRVVVRRARHKRHFTRAVYKSVAQTRMVRPARTVWKRKWTRNGHYKCKVTIPAKYRTRHHRVLVTPSKRWTTTVPAVTGWQTHRVRISHRQLQRICHPATYKWVAQRVLVSRGHRTWIRVKNGPKC